MDSGETVGVVFEWFPCAGCGVEHIGRSETPFKLDGKYVSAVCFRKYVERIVDERVAELRRLRSALKEVEWMGGEDEGYCPACGVGIGERHLSGCVVYCALEGKDPPCLSA